MFNFKIIMKMLNVIFTSLKRKIAWREKTDAWKTTHTFISKYLVISNKLHN